MSSSLIFSTKIKMFPLHHHLLILLLFNILPSISTIFVLSTSSKSSSCKNEVAIEHFFFDLQKTTTKFISLEYLEQEGNFRSPVSIKLQCKAAGCPELNGTKIYFEGIPHHQEELMISSSSPSSSDAGFWVEETSGWLLFYHDRDWKKPLLLTEKTVTAKEQEQGFVYFETKKGTKNGGVVKFKCDES